MPCWTQPTGVPPDLRSEKDQCRAHHSQHTSIEDMNPDRINWTPMTHQNISISNSSAHPAAEEDPQSLALASEFHPPDRQAGGEFAASKARVEDYHLGRGIDDAENTGHACGVEDAVEAGADEECADDSSYDVDGKSGVPHLDFGREALVNGVANRIGYERE